jgi:hypothetical protein
MVVMFKIRIQSLLLVKLFSSAYNLTLSPHPTSSFHRQTDSHTHTYTTPEFSTKVLLNVHIVDYNSQHTRQYSDEYSDDATDPICHHNDFKRGHLIP